MKRQILFGVLLVAALDAGAAQYPARPVRLVVPFGAGSVTDVLARSVRGELFKSMTGVDMVHIAYKASPLAHVDLIGGHVQVMFDGLPAAIPLVKAGSPDTKLSRRDSAAYQVRSGEVGQDRPGARAQSGLGNFRSSP